MELLDELRSVWEMVERSRTRARARRARPECDTRGRPRRRRIRGLAYRKRNPDVWPHTLTSGEFTRRLGRTVTEVSVPTILDFSRLPLEERLSLVAIMPRSCHRRASSTGGGGAVVNLGLSLVQIERVDLLHGKLDLHVWLRMAWTDQRLRWNAADSQLTELRVPAARLWMMPDLGLLNGEMSSSKFFFPTRPLDVTLHRNGTVVSSRLVKLSVLCSFTGIRRFPGDTLKCTILFGSPGIDASQQDLAWGAIALRVMGESGDRTDNVFGPDLFQGDEYKKDFLEYSIVNDTWGRIMNDTKYSHGEFPFAPGTNFTVLELELPIRRHVKFYHMKVIFWTMLLTYLTFGVFYAHPKAINRQHFSATLAARRRDD